MNGARWENYLLRSSALDLAFKQNITTLLKQCDDENRFDFLPISLHFHSPEDDRIFFFTPHLIFLETC